MMELVKHTLKGNFPRVYSVLRYIRRQTRTEYKVVRQIGFRTLLRGKLWNSAPWRELLPMQAPQRIVINDIDFDSIEGLLEILESRHLAYSTGGNTIYLPPTTVQATGFNVLRQYYPPNVGIKIVRDPGSVAESSYLSKRGRSLINKRLIRSHGHLSLVANFLHQSSLGPRLYDLAEFQCGDRIWTAYVVEHIDGSHPSVSECEQGLNRIRELECANVFKVTVPGGYEHRDFQCPECNGNAMMDAHGHFHYVDFQNFVLMEYERVLQNLADRAKKDTHFGDKSLLRGGNFLYQSVPGVRLPARRSIEERIVVLDQFMESTGFTVRDRLVLDIGCNIGMMMAEYLKRGAKWCHGWDIARTIPHTKALLLALGCTRFSTTGGFIENSMQLEKTLPDFLTPSLQGCVISYLAIRKHLGWLEAIGYIPWSFLIYEGHQNEDIEHFDRDIEQLRGLVDFELVKVGSYKDGTSDERVVAMLINKSSSLSDSSIQRQG